MDELRADPAPLLDLDQSRHERLEQERLRILASAVGDHPSPLEQLARLDDLQAQLRDAPRASA